MIYYIITFIVLAIIFRKFIFFILTKIAEIFDVVKKDRQMEHKRKKEMRNWIKTRKKINELCDEF